MDRDDGDINSATREDSERCRPDGLPVELFTAGDDEFVKSMYQLICRIWLEECMASDWNFSDLCPFLKKGDQLKYAPTIGL